MGILASFCRSKSLLRNLTKEMAEEEGFEPPIPFQVRQFSRLEPSTTRPLFLFEVYYAEGECAKRYDPRRVLEAAVSKGVFFCYPWNLYSRQRLQKRVTTNNCLVQFPIERKDAIRAPCRIVSQKRNSRRPSVHSCGCCEFTARCV
jgi:hypothetical protein